jgi:hypothetical protein
MVFARLTATKPSEVNDGTPGLSLRGGQTVDLSPAESGVAEVN